MSCASILAIIALVGSQAAFADVVRHSTIPQSIQATWAVSVEGCKNADKSVIVLSTKTYVSSGMNCTVNWVSEIPSARGPVYSARMQCSSAAGQAQKTAANLVLSPIDSGHLSAGSDFDNLTTYQRCPSNKK